MVNFTSACNSNNLQAYGQPDPNDKTVTVPAGSEGLKGRLKQVLAEEGWKMVVYAGPTVTQGTSRDSINVKQYDTFNTRYRLLLTSNQLDVCLNGKAYVAYDISMIDNKTGSEVFTLSGRSCDNLIVGKFAKAIGRKD